MHSCTVRQWHEYSQKIKYFLSFDKNDCGYGDFSYNGLLALKFTNKKLVHKNLQRVFG